MVQIHLQSWVGQHPIAAAVALLLTYFVIDFCWKGYKIRSRFRNLPGPPHHWVWGHIPILLELLKEIPINASSLYYADLLREKYNLGDIFYFDLWPIGMQFLMILDPDITKQIIVRKPTHKNSMLKLFMRFLVGSHDNLLSADGHTWMKLRRIFNPGFASSHLSTMIPGIVEETEIFSKTLEEYAQKERAFRLDETATLLTIDVIGRLILDTQLHSQTAPNELTSAIISQVAWIPQARPTRPWEIFNPTFLVMMWRNNRKMDAYISDILEKRFAEQRADRTKGRNVMDLALDAYGKGKGQSEEALPSVPLDPGFKRDAICQAKTFMFAGHDTISGTLCYAYYLLHKNPDKMAKLRAEHDEVLGTDEAEAGKLITAQPNILNKLEYTLCVLKETLRLYPPASTLREGNKNLFITDPVTGASLPTEDFAVSPITIGMQRHPKHFPNPHAFIPERFLPRDGPDGQKFSDSSNLAYLPFSKGPRICIGQELAITEMKIVLAMTVRKFDIRSAFEDLKLLKGGPGCWPSDESGIQKVYGDEAYQIMMGSAKPREGMPARVSVRKQG
ncbi:cytochrome P450 monooxygenase-like protein [Sodiomyces alkalinus F11]|uniref:Cytochrome P450 monooxygenase-like protein n=1 Tax=Sodiomyces alkalinus (strain CBS 110278 / VKM F-3762 / F11) TaxID=1314773 RepID=A0A3N2Q2V5_SODAK|nr:cytochrome P450 monooxygenase-like protein [Sodiomyces alkalinus F11]ROT41099.1 cytochrome P450 monooxygenase-like protein [Sodiomyces alkalinus F11]